MMDSDSLVGSISDSDTVYNPAAFVASTVPLLHLLAAVFHMKHMKPRSDLGPGMMTPPVTPVTPVT